MAIDFGAGTASSTVTVQSGAFGVATIGSITFGGSGSISYTQFEAPVETDETIFYDSPYGRGFLGARIYDKPLIRQVPQVFSVDASALEITFFDRNGGAVVGRIGTDVQENIIQSLQWQIDREGGSGDALIKLSALPAFPLLPLAEVGIRFGRASEPQYRGTLYWDPSDGTTLDEYELKVTGLREQMKQVRSETIKSGPADVGQTFRDLATQFVAGNTSIRVSSSRIQNTTGTLHQNALDFTKDSVDKVFDALSTMADAAGRSYNWYVDGDGLLNFQAEPLDVVKTFQVGVGTLIEFKPQQNVESVRNSVIVKRNAPSESGETGWTTSANSPYNDLTSQAKYGFREDTFQVPGYFLDNEMDIVGNQLIADLSEPQENAKAVIKIETVDDILSRGIYRFVSGRSEIASDIVDPDTAAGWSKFGSGDLSVGFSTTTIISGAGSLQLDYTSAVSDRAEYAVDPILRTGIKTIQFWIRSAKAGQLLTFGVGESAWDENTKDVTIPGSSAWFPIVWDVSSLDPTIGCLAFRVDDPGAATIYIDRIQAVSNDNRHYLLRFTRGRYKWAPDTGLLCDAEFGPLTPDLEQYIKQLVKFDQQKDVTLERRV